MIKALEIKKLYILPTKIGIIFTLIVLSLGAGAVNYQLNPAFLLTFLLISTGILGMLQTHQNLSGLKIQVLPIEDTMVSNPLILKLIIESSVGLGFGLQFYIKKNFIGETSQLKGASNHPVELKLMTHNRGYYEIPTIRLQSTFPLGLFRVFTYLRLNQFYYVYPKATDPGYWPIPYLPPAYDKMNQAKKVLGDDELYELIKSRNEWVGLGRIAWKISARGQGLFIKKMEQVNDEVWLFRLSDMRNTNLEHALEGLCYWIKKAESLQQRYGLLLDKQTEISNGKAHEQHCLRQLALYHSIN